MRPTRTRRVTLMLGAGSAAIATWVLLPVGSAVAQPVERPRTEPSAVEPARVQDLGVQNASNDPQRAYGLSAAADLVRAGGTAGVATGGGLILGVVTGPVAGIPGVGPGLADQATKTWGTLQASIGEGAVTAADAIRQVAEPLAPPLNEVGGPVVTSADSLASSGAATEDHLNRFGFRTNLLSYPFAVGAQLAHALR